MRRAYKTDQGQVRYAELVGADGDDEIDGGPPYSAHYITERSDPYKPPSMELECLIFEFDAYRNCLEAALEESAPALFVMSNGLSANKES